MHNPKNVKSTHPWIESAKFENVPQKDLLKKIISDTKAECKKRTAVGGKVVKVVFDVDSTLFDVKPRTLKIMKEFAAGEGRKISPTLSDWCMNLKVYQLSYTLKDTAIANNFPKDEANAELFMKTLFPFWKERFFKHEYVLTDHPMPGAVDFVQSVVDVGAQAVYLTGRDIPGMGRGTQSMLEHWGFPMGNNRAELIMKPFYGMDDAEFKDVALLQLRSHSDVVALFDNEPANFIVFEKNFPDAHLVFLHSNCSEKDAMPVRRIYRIEDFLMH